ncbi:hypothetical protein CBL_05263 [Carabus blaptoides fortunei]
MNKSTDIGSNEECKLIYVFRRNEHTFRHIKFSGWLPERQPTATGIASRSGRFEIPVKRYHMTIGCTIVVLHASSATWPFLERPTTPSRTFTRPSLRPCPPKARTSLYFDNFEPDPARGKFNDRQNTPAHTEIMNSGYWRGTGKGGLTPGKLRYPERHYLSRIAVLPSLKRVLGGSYNKAGTHYAPPM